MGEETSSIEREIAHLRADSDHILEELERRIRYTLDVRSQAEHHPMITTALAIGLVTGVGLLVYNVFLRSRLPDMQEYAHRPRVLSKPSKPSGFGGLHLTDWLKRR
jgi:hypothetical protein